MLTHTNMPTCRRHRGLAVLGFSLASLGLLAVLVISADIAYSVWVRVALGQAVREGARFAITGRSFDHMGQEESIRQVVRQGSFGLLDDAEDSQIEVRYSVTESEITFLHLRVKAFRPTPLAAVLGSSYPIDLSAGCSTVVDRLGTRADLRDVRERPLATNRW